MADWEATKRSYELFADEVIPYFRRSNRNRVASLDYHAAHAQQLGAGVVQAITQATQQYYGQDAQIHIR
jgi:limonene 1,2-monooxygenase